MLEAMRGLNNGLFNAKSFAKSAGEDREVMSFLRPGMRPQVDYIVEAGGHLAVIYVEIENFGTFLDIYDEMVCRRIEDVAEDEITFNAVEVLDKLSIWEVDRLGNGAFLLMCGGKTICESCLGDWALTLRLKIRSRVRSESLNLTGQGLNIVAGSAMIDTRLSSLQDGVFQAVSDARNVAKGTMDFSKLSLLREFRDVIAGKQLQSVYQPIVELASGDIMAWEALTRGPNESRFQSPAVLFDFAEEAEQVFSLERECRETAVRGLGVLPPGSKLFLNIHPRTLVDPDFSPGQTVRLLEQFGLSPSDVVLEITERHSVRDFTLFHRTLEHYRNQGFRIAIDDVGTGYSGLQTIAELRPEFLKVDMSLVRGINADPVKRALMETLVTFAENIGCRIIAEGIEEEAELNTLMRMGVHYGQGFFLQRPASPKPGLSGGVQTIFSSSSSVKVGGGVMSNSLPRLLDAPVVVEEHASVSEVKELIGNAGPMGAAVVIRDDRPVGLVMNHHLDRALSSRYGMSLYYNRPVSLVMDPSPLYAETASPVENVAREAMKRAKSKLFDHVVVTEHGLLHGTISVQRMMDTIASAQVELAKGANPLTGLPGNVAIEIELERHSSREEPFSVIYADLDNFKVYNDSYGFKNGDKVLLLLSKILQWAGRRHVQGGSGFVGHIGGDDFVIVCPQENAQRVCQAITRCFGRLVGNCYMSLDRQRGWIHGNGRDGKTGQFPLVSVSLAIVDCSRGCRMADLAHRAAEMKKYAKSIEGNSYVRDRRGPLACGVNPNIKDS